MRELFETLEAAVLRRNPEVVAHLRPGLTEYRIRKMLGEGKVLGSIEPIIALFSWKNGTLPHAGIARETSSLFPATDYVLTELNFMISHFGEYEEISMSDPRYSEVSGRYFPLFRNGSTNFMALDLDPAGGSQVVIIERKAKQLVRTAYPSFRDFLQDAIRANDNNAPLACFPMDPSPTVGPPTPVQKPQKA